MTYFTAEEARKYAAENTGFVFLDVRSTQEFSFAHVKDALNIPLEMIEKKSISLDRSTTYLVYGNTMLDAFQAAVRLSDLNFALVRRIRVEQAVHHSRAAAVRQQFRLKSEQAARRHQEHHARASAARGAHFHQVATAL